MHSVIADILSSYEHASWGNDAVKHIISKVHYNYELHVKPAGESDDWHIFPVSFSPLLSQIISALSAIEQKVTLLRKSTRGANLQGPASISEALHDKTQVGVKKEKKWCEASEWSMDHKGTDRHWKGHLVGIVINPAEWLAWKLLAPHALSPPPSLKPLGGTLGWWWSVKTSPVTLITANEHCCDPAALSHCPDAGWDNWRRARDQNKSSGHCDKLSVWYGTKHFNI